ncbi:odorant receptor 33b-like [Scaptodrosophila lebanonensis]|uniref:Odorant receptor n=1 Tax=Drosophila lebanonensis TaxID=7225 RepID=A0A6J2U989_DROLE|nr:odorant receptor 33b-like [Scaptodrosophila lebanonensis]
MADVPPDINSAAIYRVYWLYWRLMGVESNCQLVDVLMNIFVTFLFPFHLLIGLLGQRSLSNIFENLPITAACFFCSVKILCIRPKLKEIKIVERLLGELDKRANSWEERKYFDEVIRPQANFVWKSFLVAYFSTVIMATATVSMAGGRQMLYPAWFPYDVQATALRYWLSFGYQAVGNALTVLQNLTNDSYPPMTFCVVAGHVRMLALRIARIGQAGESAASNYKQLIDCIKDHQKLMEIVQRLRGTLHLALLSQFVASCINISIVLIFVLFFSESTFVSIYYSLYFAAMVLEFFPLCYYGSLLTFEFAALPYALFSCSWPDMDRRFCRHVSILMQMTLSEVTIKAGGFLCIDMNAFFATVRAAYSLFTLAMTFR